MVPHYLAPHIAFKSCLCSGIGEIGDGEAREMRSADIEEQLKKSTTKDPSKSYREKFDGIRLDIPRYPCSSCDKLTTPSRIKKINTDTWKVFKKKDDLDIDHPYVQLGVLLIENDMLAEEEEAGTALDEEILREYGADDIASSDENDEDESTNEHADNRLLYCMISTPFTIIMYFILRF